MEQLRATGFYDKLVPGDWVLLGLVIEGGQGLATADDKRFLAAIEGTEEARRHVANQERLEELVLAHDEAARVYKTNLGKGREAALLEVNERFDARSLRWPKGGAFRVAPRGAIHEGGVSAGRARGRYSRIPFLCPLREGR